MNTFNGHQFSRALSTSGFVGCMVGLLDFLFFELSDNTANIVEFALYKPSLLGLSFLSLQLMLFSALGIVLSLVFLLTFCAIPKSKFRKTLIRIPAFVTVTLIVVLLTIRFYRRPSLSAHLAVFVVCVTVMTAIIVFARKRRSNDPGSNDAGSDAVHLGPLLFLVFMILISCMAPDIYSFLMRLGQSKQGYRSARPNVLLIVMDTVRADHLSCYGYGKPTSPNIDRVAAEGVLFTGAFATAPWTLPSHASMFTGMYPSQHRATWSHQYLDGQYLTLAEHFLDAGYLTAGFSENPFAGAAHGLAQGFSEFHETWRRPLVGRAFKKIASQAIAFRDRLEYAERTTGIFQRWFFNHRADSRPFFAFINLMTAHHPRYPRKGYGSEQQREEDLKIIEPVNLVPERFYLPRYRLSTQELSTMKDVYDGEIGYLDEKIACITRHLETYGILDNTILIVTSDHGENFGDHGYIEHQFCLYNSLIRVPLIIRYPPRVSPGIVHKNVSQVDLFSTILELLDNPKSTTSGDYRDSLLNDADGDHAIFAEFSNAKDMLQNVIGHEAPDFDFEPFDRDLKCVMSGSDKFIWSSNGEHELYSLEGDFDELHDLFHADSDRARELNQRLTQWILSHESTPSSQASPEIDRGTRDALRALGYEQ